ncbi:MAG: PAS domain S-box protein [Bacteroidota bacterium]
MAQDSVSMPESEFQISSSDFLALFGANELQSLQDLFAEANGVASIITHPDGTPLTNPSNFCRLCSGVIRKTEKGLANCFASDAELGRQHPTGPIVQPCLSGGLWDAGASITIGGCHVANWLIGQVRNEDLDESLMLNYADEIGVERSEFLTALQEVPEMSREQFERVSKMLFVFANNISEKAYSMYLLKNQIVERDQALSSLRESEERFQTLFNRAPLGYQSLDEDGNFIEVNDQWLRTLGYSRDEVIGKWFGDFLPPPYREGFIERFPLFKKEGRIHSEFGMIHKNGQHLFIAFEGKIGYNDKGQFQKTHCILQDITESRRAEKLLIESEKKYRTIFETTVEGICIVDERQVITSVNPTFSRMLGYNVEELEGMNFESIFPAEDLDTMRERMRSRETGVSGKYEQRLVRRDNSLLWTSVSASPMFDGAGKYMGSFGMFSDITERKTSERELLRAKEQAERSEKLKDAFVANISHEIRTPLNSIAGFSMLIEEACTAYLDESQQSYFEHVQFGVQRLLRTVDLILILSRIQSGDLQLSRTPIDLHTQLSYIREGFIFQTAQKNITLNYENELGHLTISTDEYCLTEAISNLVNNAIKFTDQGSVTIRLYGDGNDRVMLDIADTGVGISDEYKPLLFNPYTQEDIGYSRRFDGIGLGLSLVKKYLDLLGLPIWFESVKGKGTVFHIDLTQTVESAN